MPRIDAYKSSYPRCMVALGTSTCCQMKDFLPSKRKGLLQHIVDKEESALARLAFYENNSLTGKEISVRCHINGCPY